MQKHFNNNLLTIGEIFKTVAGEFKIVRRVGQGATGEVYEAQSRDGKRTVAIKMMRPTDMLLARKLFIGEGLTLVEMRSAEKRQKDGFFVTPEYFGADEKADPPYIVEEFMMGRRFPDLVIGDHLSEEDVVYIGVQLFRTLHLLSKELEKNYFDLKFENLWWDQKKKVLKITDWGTLEETSPSGQSRDILRASLYVYRLATGRPITESRGILNQAVDAFPEWGQISWGLQEILRRLLHPIPSARVGDDLLSLDTAEKIAQEFRNLEEYWKEPDDELLADIRTSVDAAQKSNPEKEIEQQTLHYRLARTALEISSKRGIPNGEFVDRLQSIIVAESDYYTRAHNLYEGTSYAPARKLFQIGARLLSSSKLRRWAWLAYAGELAREKNYSGVKDLAEHAVELMEKDEFKDAGVSLDTALETLKSEPLQTLDQECKVLNLVQYAISAQRNGEYKSAEDAYRSAYAIWVKTDDHNEWKDKIGDLLRQADIVHRRFENQEKVNASLEKLTTVNELAIILDELPIPLGLDPGNLAIYTLVNKIANERFTAGLLEDAAQILWVCGIAPDVPSDAIDWRYPEEIRKALASEKLDDASHFVAAIRNDKNALPYKLAVAFLEKYFILSDNDLGLGRNDVIADLLIKLDPENGSKKKEQVQRWRKESLTAGKDKVNRLISDVDRLLFADRPGSLQGLSMSQAFASLQNRLQEVENALGMLDRADLLAGSDPEVVRSKIGELKQRGVTMKNELGRTLSENKNQKEETITVLKEKTEDILAQLDQLEDASTKLSKAGLPSQISDNINGFQADRLGEVFELCNQVLDLDSENQWALQIQQKVKSKLQGLGDFATLSIVSQKNVLDAAVEALLREVQDLYQNGKVLEAGRSLRKIESLDPQAGSRRSFLELKAKTTVMLGLKYWEQENKAELEKGEFEPQLIERIATHFSAEIPMQFRKESLSIKYLSQARSKLLDELLKSNPNNDTPIFAETLSRLVWTSNLYSRGLAWQKNQMMSQNKENWNSVRFVQKVLQAYKKGKLKGEIEKLLAGVQIIGDLKVRLAQLPSEISQLVPESLDPKPRRAWWKWTLAGCGSFAVIGILASLLIWNYIPGFVLGTATPTIIVVAVTQTTIPITLPNVKPTAKPSIIPTASPTAIPTFNVTSQPALPTTMVAPTGTIKACTNKDLVEVYKVAKDFTSKEGSPLNNGQCLFFNAWMEDPSFQGWFRIAPGQIPSLDGGWVMGNRLKLPLDKSWETTLEKVPSP